MTRTSLSTIILLPALFVTMTCMAAPSYKDSFKDSQPALSWTGLYAGISLGNAWDSVRNSLSVVNNPANPYFVSAVIPGVNAAGSPSVNSSRMFEAIQVGYNYQQNEVVYSIELAGNDLNNSSRRGGTYYYSTNGSPYTLQSNTTVNWLISLRPRVGLAYYNALFYVNGGLSVAQFEYSQYFNEATFTPTPENPSFNQTRAGWNAGAGVEYRVTTNWKVRAEYSFNRFSYNYPTGTLIAPGGGATFYNTQRYRNINLLSVGVNYSLT